ncbi:MAG: DUF192 domain-containing protein [Myxococcota bacterium]
MRTALCSPLLLMAALACHATPPPAHKTDTRAMTPGENAPSTILSPQVTVVTPGGELRFEVEVARTPQQRARGLMFRESLADNAGMIFLFDHDEDHSFWMKNTKVPLDMIFIDSAGVIVGMVENAEPFSLNSRSIGEPSRYVLEVTGGTCRRLGIAPGQRFRFSGIPGHPQP